MKVGFIGLGAMGLPMARNLAKAGFLKAIWNRTPATAKALAQELKIARAREPAELAGATETIFMCVSADQDVLALVEALASGLTPGKIVVDFSTVSWETARRAAAIVHGKGAEFLDSPVSGGVEGARNGTLAIMVGGPGATLAKIRPALETLASRIMHMGEVGAGQATKAVNQIMAAGINQAVAEALAFGKAQGLDMEKVIAVVSRGAASNWFLEKRGKTMTQGIFAPGFKISLHHKDLRICQAMAEQLGFPLPVTTMTLADYQRLLEQGFGDEDISALYRLKRPD
ncbi:NAD(P)-dependent oxidoreductase [Nitrosococcus watsonii]|uniref:6-phosphogluconate dehydrogenase NAD-binding protein n=1 Tax=Nitrosococcus watsoni (strain C-113) TaxID=105559 RepID=D8K4Y5_NITWC|nr:NAD(P)-dependent oxidoreductase [Nitrosococcus watsonii]ADJ27962.1 6-phosphogluconate dehydrogenase NAD-binding protein [Nitrosococcus watsonii C-113]